MKAALLLLAAAAAAQTLPPNKWTELSRDPQGARPGSAIRYASAARQFFLWGFMNSNQDLPQEQPLMEVPEYDMVAFDPAARRWTSQLPPALPRIPLAYVPRTYSGITTGSERTIMRGASDDKDAIPRPDLNIAFDQVAYRPADNSLYYFTGGLTAAYDVARRRWRDLRPAHSPPPVLGGSLAYDPVHDAFVLFGGGHVAERWPDGSLRGYTGTWLYSVRDNDWRLLATTVQPPPRMCTRLVLDTRNRVLVLFGGDGQKVWLADTWLFDLETLAWKQSRAPGAPPARAGHFTVYDPETGLVLVGGGYNRRDISDMWAYDPAADRWTQAAGEVPAGFHLTADLAPDSRVIVLVTSTRAPGDRTACNVLFPVRTTYGYRIDASGLLRRDAPVEPQSAIARRERESAPPGLLPADIPANRWVQLPPPGRAAPTRTWGSATFDSARGQILYWGGGHCGYEGSDMDAYDAGSNTWIPEPGPPSYPERLWNHGVRLAGVTFDGEPWTDHGRRIYAYDPAGGRLIMVRPIRLTCGYEPDWLRAFPSKTNVAPDALVSQPSSYSKYVTWTYDLTARRWSVLGPAPAGLETLASTPLGAMGVNVNWPARLNDAGYELPRGPAEDNAVWLLRGSEWERLSEPGESPQNLYEMTSLAWDSRRGRLILHGAGEQRKDVWTFDPKTRRWENRHAKGEAPPCLREAVYLPGPDVFLTYGAGTWAYLPGENEWRKLPVPDPPLRAGQNRAMVYDAKRDLVLLVLGPGGDQGRAAVFALRLQHVPPF